MGQEWRDSFLLERGKMSTERFRKIKDTMMFGLNSSFSHNLPDTEDLEHTPIHALGRVSRQERLAIGNSIFKD